MTINDRIAVLGGDRRQLFLLRYLLERGYRVTSWGLGEEGRNLFPTYTAPTLEAALKEAHVLVLPFPVSVDGVRLRCPLEKEELSIRLSILLDGFQGEQILGGRLPEAFVHSMIPRGITPVDYATAEPLLLKNAMLTAEGAISLAMEKLPVALDGSCVAVIGYGRIGSLLADRLRGLGAHVLVYARREASLTLASLCHHTPVALRCEEAYECLKHLPSSCRVVFNTVPECLFSREVLSAYPKECLFVDLASAPGGIDRTAADGLGIPWIWGTALPGRYAPESAGIALAQTVEHLLEARL